MFGALVLPLGCGGTTHSETGGSSDGSGGGAGDDGSGCPLELQRKAEAFQDVAWALSAVVPSLAAEMARACAQVLVDLGVPDGATAELDGPVSDEQLAQTCGAMFGAIQGFVDAGGTAAVLGSSGECQLAARSQLDCEADCDVLSECDPGTVEERCPPDALVAPCTGDCDGNLACQSEDGLPVGCNGDCSGTCSGGCERDCYGECSGTCGVLSPNGECAGPCDGDCVGACTGTCTGSCDAKCMAPAESAVECDATRICRGVCLDGVVAANCAGELDEPSCQLDEDCAVACAAFGALGALCTPPHFVFSGVEPAVAQHVEPAALGCFQAAFGVARSTEAVVRMEDSFDELSEHGLCVAQAVGLESMLEASVAHVATLGVMLDTCSEPSMYL